MQIRWIQVRSGFACDFDCNGVAITRGLLGRVNAYGPNDGKSGSQQSIGLDRVVELFCSDTLCIIHLSYQHSCSNGNIGRKSVIRFSGINSRQIEPLVGRYRLPEKSIFDILLLNLLLPRIDLSLYLRIQFVFCLIKVLLRDSRNLMCFASCSWIWIVNRKRCPQAVWCNRRSLRLGNT